MSRELLYALAVSLVATLAFEAGFFWLIGKRGKKDLLLVIAVNVITNPAVVLLYWLAVLYTGINPILVKAALEILAVLTEGFYYKKYGQEIRRPFLFSLAANAVSFGLGMLIQFFV